MYSVDDAIKNFKKKRIKNYITNLMLINSSVTNKINSHKTIKNKFSIYFVEEW